MEYFVALWIVSAIGSAYPCFWYAKRVAWQRCLTHQLTIQNADGKFYLDPLESWRVFGRHEMLNEAITNAYLGPFGIFIQYKRWKQARKPLDTPQEYIKRVKEACE